MISRQEYKYIKSKINRLEQSLLEFEVGSPIWKQLDRFLHLNQQEREELIAEWDRYFDLCRQGYWGKAFFSLKPIFKVGESETIKIAIKLLKENDPKEEINSPTGQDPATLFRELDGYFSAKNNLKKLKEVEDEYQPVYGSKEETL